MKPCVGLFLALLGCLVAGCSHINTISMPASAASKPGVGSVDLTSFWREQGFTLVDPGSELGKVRYTAAAGGKVVAVWEKWYKGVIFEYSGGMWATEAIRGDRYEIIFMPISSTRDYDTQEMARRLKAHLDKNFPAARAAVASRAFMDVR